VTDQQDSWERRKQRIAACSICKGTGWVCENHRDRSWPDVCECGPGAPCVCNIHGFEEASDAKLALLMIIAMQLVQRLTCFANEHKLTGAAL
jgi:hypothetical protein